MKQKLLSLLSAILITASGFSQIVANQVDDFEDDTVQGWEHKLTNPDDPVNITTGGPAGVNDNYLRNANNGVNATPGAKHIMFNNNGSRWKGNFASQSIAAIRMDVRNPGTESLHLRVALRGGPNVSWMSTTTAEIVLPVAPEGPWKTIEIPISSTDFTVTQGTDTAADILLDVIEMRILSNDGSEASLHKGDLRVQISEYDNIKASTTFLSTRESKLDNAFSISPNPGSTRLNLKLSKLNINTSIEVFDVLGKKIFADRLTDLTTSVDVSRWNSAVYLVRLTTDSGTQTKRFVKQ